MTNNNIYHFRELENIGAKNVKELGKIEKKIKIISENLKPLNNKTN